MQEGSAQYEVLTSVRIIAPASRVKSTYHAPILSSLVRKFPSRTTLERTISYRPDIDGLRAVAVLGVVLFHLDAGIVPGGFVGVDMFFVISGYLITGIIFRQSRDGSFSFAEFYRRRIRRILPVLTTVILATLAVGQVLLLPEDLEQLSASAIASQLFVGNVYFTYFLDHGYFADDASLQPLLHLWSLGVEEQFYLLWPAVLVGLLAWKRKYSVPVALVLVMVLSFFLPVIVPSVDPVFLYYMLPARAGELAVGGGCFFLATSTKRPSQVVAHIAAWVGLILVAWSLWFVTSETPFPGPSAIPISIGTALLIYAGVRENLVSRILSGRIAVSIGLVSYSLYLWHWPVVAFLKYLMVEIDLMTGALALAVMAALSFLSYRFVEQPFRRSAHAFRRVFATQFLVPTLVIVALSTFFQRTDGYGFLGLDPEYRMSLMRQEEAAARPTLDSRVCQQKVLEESLFTDPRCLVNGTEEPSILLWGDSNASHYVAALAVLAETYGFAFRDIAHSSCPPVFEGAERFAPKSVVDKCRVSSALVQGVVRKYETVIIAAGWLNYHRDGFDEALRTTITQLQDEGKRVIILGVIPRIRTFDRDCERKAVKFGRNLCGESSTVNEDETRKTNDWIRNLVESAGATYVDFNKYLCSDGQCSAYADGHLVYFDRSHLSVSGSERLGRMALGSDEAMVLKGLLAPQEE